VQRSDELAVLSREHHVALELALRLQRAGNSDAEVIMQATLDFWSEEGREHFHIEEEYLLPALVRRAGSDDADVVRVLGEHADIGRRVADLQAEAPVDRAALNTLGERLRDHVRYEERSLFGRIEDTLSSEELRSLGASLRAAGEHHRPPRV
jgi:hemerythrin-like domain-containing protein